MNTLKRFARALGVALLCMATVNSAMAAVVTYYHNDISGSPIAATDAAGNLKWKESYKPYGDKLTRAAASADNEIGFHGKAHDDSTGLSYMGARYYDPVLGRFMGVDPVGFQTDNLHSFNRYTYANNNPYRYVDPDGEFAIFAIPFAQFLFAATAALVAGAVAKAVISNQSLFSIFNPHETHVLAPTNVDSTRLPNRQSNSNYNKSEEENTEKTEKTDPKDAPYPDNPKNSDFERIRGSKAKLNPQDGSVWEKDTSSHGGEQWKRWKDFRSWEKKDTPNSIWPDGRIRK